MKTETKTEMKKIVRINRGGGGHWVGDGFPVDTLFFYGEDGGDIDPFLLLDYAGPADFNPSDRPRGVGTHPHRGFETVTIVYQGEVAHRDSAGNAGTIGPGDVQWMTAARGVLHEEMHSLDFTRRGGTLEMVQLWVNLPAKDKMGAPAYQEIRSGDIPAAALPGGGSLRVIAGEYEGLRGAARSFTPLNVWDMRLKAGAEIRLPVPEGHNAMLLVRSGTVIAGSADGFEGEAPGARDLVLFSREGGLVNLRPSEDTAALLLSGAPIGEAVAGHGPFVMNTQDEIRKAFEDYRAGRFA